MSIKYLKVITNVYFFLESKSKEFDRHVIKVSLH